MARKRRSSFRARTPGRGPEISRRTLSRMELWLQRYVLLVRSGKFY